MDYINYKFFTFEYRLFLLLVSENGPAVKGVRSSGSRRSFVRNRGWPSMNLADAVKVLLFVLLLLFPLEFLVAQLQLPLVWFLLLMLPLSCLMRLRPWCCWCLVYIRVLWLLHLHVGLVQLFDPLTVVKHLVPLLAISGLARGVRIVVKVKHLDGCQMVVHDHGDAPPVVEPDLPDAVHVLEQVADELTRVDVPQLERALRPGHDLELVVLKRADDALVALEHVQQRAVVGVPHTERAVGCCGDNCRPVEIHEADQRCMALQGVEHRAGLKRPQLDKPVHRPRDAAVALRVNHDTVHALLVATQNPLALASLDDPDAHIVVVAARHDELAVTADGAHTIAVARHGVDEVVVAGRRHGVLGVDGVWVGLGQLPDLDGVISRACDNKRFLGRHDGIPVGVHANLLGHHNVEAAHGGVVVLKDVGASLVFNVPDSDGAIGRARNQSVSDILECPHAIIMALELGPHSASGSVVNGDCVVVASDNNFFLVKLKTGDNVVGVPVDGQVVWTRVRVHPVLFNKHLAPVYCLVDVDRALQGGKRLVLCGVDGLLGRRSVGTNTPREVVPALVLGADDLLDVSAQLVAFEQGLPCVFGGVYHVTPCVGDGAGCAKGPDVEVSKDCRDEFRGQSGEDILPERVAHDIEHGAYGCSVAGLEEFEEDVLFNLLRHNAKVVDDVVNIMGTGELWGDYGGSSEVGDYDFLHGGIAKEGERRGVCIGRVFAGCF